MKEARRDYRSLALSVALHVVIATFVLQAAIGKSSLSGWFRERSVSRPAAEKLIYVPLAPRAIVDSVRAQVDGGDNRAPSRNVATAPPLRAPTSVPTTLPPASTVPTDDAGGSGLLVGGGGVLRGVQPSYGDPRIWTGPAPLVSAPKSEDERRDSVLASRLNRYRDSMAVAARTSPREGPPDWTFERNGQKYGIDEKYIRLGKFSLPTAVLAALPFNAKLAPNPIEMERAARREAMRAEINVQSRRRMNEEEFRTAVKAIRERKEREKREASKRPADPPPPIAGGTE